MMFRNIFCLNRPESTKANMQCNKSDFNALLTDFVQQFRSKMQAGSGCGSRTYLTGVDSLVWLKGKKKGESERDVRRMVNTVLFQKYKSNVNKNML